MTATSLPVLNPQPGLYPTPFRWNFKGRVIAVDQGAGLVTRKDFLALLALDALSVITFDPASRLHGSTIPQQQPHLQVFAGVTLGDGVATALHACLNPELSGTLAPLPCEQLPEDLQAGANVLARVPLNSLRLDSIEGLSSIDWLLLDGHHDALSILHNACASLEHTLVVQVRTQFSPTHGNSADFGQLCQLLAEHGLQFYRFNNPTYLSQFPARLKLENSPASQLQSANALFVPSRARLDQLPAQRRLKLAFILDAAYAAHDLAYSCIASIDEGQAQAYLEARHYVNGDNDPHTTFTLTAEYSPAPW